MHKLPKTEKMENRKMERKPYEAPTIVEVELGVSAPLLDNSTEYGDEMGLSSNPDGGIA